ncbi:MAG: hypothetical protein Q4G22_07355 [Paracoccus sp. (in: a-proteobacteria)]|uniref:hypothetical protein n=1 Tax=Paracoccus sp. TaxID=267 RepID=UPI0026E04459|nr:hypothetical protein [Paracoccus sp. (in: a-proteobacteria)]MDO5631639.1 hypothetical protein [Paracoccus sp. (in: a-proteobacteria)]
MRTIIKNMPADGTEITPETVRQIMREEIARVVGAVAEAMTAAQVQKSGGYIDRHGRGWVPSDSIM